MTFDPTQAFGKHAKDYAQFRAGFPDSFFEKLIAANILRPMADVLDLGTGTGTLARGFARRGAKVKATDPNEALLNEARQPDPISDYQLGTAEKIDCADASLDLVSAGQCWHWFKPEAALKEIRRVLRPSGHFLVAYLDWQSVEGNPVDLMYFLQKKYNPTWGASTHHRIYPVKPGDLQLLGFTTLTSFSYVENISYTHEAWRGRMRSYAGIGGSLPEEKVAAFDKEFAQLLRERFPREPMPVPHSIWGEVWRLS